MLRELQNIKKLFALLIRGQRSKFPAARERLAATSNHGVYLIMSPRGKVLHVGRTVRGRNGLRQRLNDHLQGQSSFTARYFDRKGAKLRRSHSFSYVEVPDSRARALLEAYAVGHLCPAHIGTGEQGSHRGGRPAAFASSPSGRTRSRSSR